VRWVVWRPNVERGDVTGSISYKKATTIYVFMGALET
jgi:hypothetical protein